jgi:G3E family GTPase
VSIIRSVPVLIVARRALRSRTEAIIALLQHKPAGARWAVLTQPRLVPIEAGSADVTVQSVPPGCVCCVGNVPFRVALTRLIRNARPDGLIVELGATDHLEQVQRMFADPWFSQVIELVDAVDDDRAFNAIALGRRLTPAA